MFNAILWFARSGSAWRDLPERFGSWKTVYSRFCKLRDDDTPFNIFHALNAEADYENPSLALRVSKPISTVQVLKRGCKLQSKSTYRKKSRR